MYAAASNTANFAWGFGLSRDCIVDFIQVWPDTVPRREALFADLGVPQRALMSIEGPGILPGGPAVEVFLDFPALQTAIEIRADPRHRARLCLDDSQMTFMSVLVTRHPLILFES
jgi:hypothetical protein